eukprot:g692.t1
MKSFATRDSKERNKTDGAKPKFWRRGQTEQSSNSRRGSTESCKVEGRTRSASRLSTGTLTKCDSFDINNVEGRAKSSSNLGRRPMSRRNSQEGRTLDRRSSSSRLGTPIDPNRSSSLGHNPSPAPLGSSRQPSLKDVRSTSVISTYSTASTYDSRVVEPDSAPAAEAHELKKRLQHSMAETDEIKIELQIKKDEVSKLQEKVMVLSRELSEVSTTKGALNEAFVTKMLDVLALNAKISELEEARARLDRQNQQLRHDASEYDTERRGLLDLLDDSKVQLREFEKALEVEKQRKKEIEASFATTAERLGMDLKFIRRELHEKTIRLKKLARANTKLVCKLLAVEADSVEATDLAETLKSKNSELEGDNKELASFVMQLEYQIDQMATERTLDVTLSDTNAQQLTRCEEERARMLNQILSVEEEIEQTRRSDDSDEDKEQKLEDLRDEKSELQNNVTALTNNIRALKEKQNFERQQEARMKEEYVQRLEEELRAAKTRIDELNKTLKGARDSETETMSSHMKASEEISKLEAEKARLQQDLVASDSRLKTAQSELQNEVEAVRQQKDQEIQDLQSEVNLHKKKMEILDKRVNEYHRIKQDSDAEIKKLKQDIEEHEQQKENFAYQVNVLEWQLVSLYSDKEDAVRSLAHKDMEIARLQQELEGKEDDLAQLRTEYGAEKDAQLELYELQYSKDQMAHALSEAQRRVKVLEYELEQSKKDKVMVDEHVKDCKKKPRFRFKIRFSF